MSAHKERPIFVGDIIKLTIGNGYTSENELTEAFEAFEIVSIEAGDETYEVALRSFEPGIYEVSLAEERLTIEVADVLTHDTSEGLYEPEPLPPSAMALPYNALMAGFALIALMAILGRVALHFKSKKTKPLTPYETFQKSVSQCEGTKRGLAGVSAAFKAYLRDSGIINAEGSTTENILSALSKSGVTVEEGRRIEDCLVRCDAIYYQPIDPEEREIQGLMEELLALGEALNGRKGVEPL